MSCRGLVVHCVAFLALFGQCVLSARVLHLTSSESPVQFTITTQVPQPLVLVPGPQSNATLTTVPVNYTIYGSDSASPDLPAIFIVNGGNVPGKWYTGLAEALAKTGFVVATPDLEVEVGPPFRAQPGCEGKKVTLVFGGEITRLLEADQNLPGARQFQKTAKKNGLVLVGHSQGGNVATTVVAGQCDNPQEGGWVCGTYRPVMGERGQDVILGAVNFEGYVNRTVEVPSGRFITYTQGQYDVDTYPAYRNTSGGACVNFVQFKGMNHFGLVDYVEGGARAGQQVTPCGRPAADDPANFTITAAEQKRNVQIIADVVEASILAALKDLRGKNYMKSLQGRDDVIKVEVDSRCLS